MRLGIIKLFSSVKSGDRLTILALSRNGEIDIRYITINGYDVCNGVVSIFYTNKGGTRRRRELIFDRDIVAFEGWIPKVFNGLHRKSYLDCDSIPSKLQTLNRSFEFRLYLDSKLDNLLKMF